MTTTTTGILVVSAVLLASACSRSTAGLTIPPEQTFLLGEYADYPYRANLDNRGGEAVTVRVRDKASKEVSREVTLGADDAGKLQVAATEEVTIENPSARPAELFVAMSRGVEGMRYVDNGEQIDEVPVFAQEIGSIELDADAGPARSRVVATLERGQRFILGEGTSDSYAAEIKNRGTDVDVRVRDRRTGEQTQGFGLARRGNATVNLRPHEILTLEHGGSGATKVTVTFDRAVSGARVAAIE